MRFGLDEPLYLSPHAPGGHLAPAGAGMVHVARYGATTAAADRARLEAFAASAGITPGDIAASRFLPNMTVITALPTVGAGLAGRPPVAVAGAPGLFAAGDWAGPTGWLSDASLASGEQAGLLAARAVASPVRSSPTAVLPVGIPGDLEQMTVGVGEVPGIDPERAHVGGGRERGAAGCGFAEQLVHLVP